MKSNKAKALVMATVLGLAGLSGCGILDGSNDKKSNSPLSLDGVDAAGSTPEPTGCSGLPGPAMVEVSSPAGVKYCIDTTEVTQAQYAEFLSKVTEKPGSEHADCGSNATYAPVANPNDPYEGKECQAKFWTPATTPNHPVVCVDWCDAYAFCSWAGKRLCGKVGGGRLDTTMTGDIDPAVDPEVSQWFNACSQGGKTAYPYGNRYDPLACEGHDSMKDPDATSGHLPVQDVATRTACSGEEEPFASISDLSGSVDDFVDEGRKDASTGGTSGLMLYAVRGGNIGSTAEQLACGSGRGVYLGGEAEVIGFRCCKDLPQ